MWEPWGKLDRSAPDLASAARLTLVAHCIDVAAVMEALLALPTLQARLGAAAGRPLTALDLRRLVVLAFLHDPGKCGAGFYSRALPEEAQQAWRRVAHPDRDQAGHVAVVAPLFQGDETFDPHRAALGVDDVLGWGGALQSEQAGMFELWLASLSHHGQPLTPGELDMKARKPWPTWTRPVAGYEPLKGLQHLSDAARELFPDAFNRVERFARFEPALVHAFAGLVSLADWIGSNTDEGFFPYWLDTQTTGRWPAARLRATEVLRAMRIDLHATRLDLSARAPSFEQVFGLPPRDTQRRTAERTTDPVLTLEAETGSGKTEAALWRFKALFEAGDVDALCFLLPTRVAASGIYQRIDGFMRALFPDPALRPSTVLAVPGYLRANGASGQHTLTGFQVLWPDVPEPARPLYWAAENSKRYFAGSAVAATIDQFLLSTLQVKHAHMRASLALRALVVVDEVHASDAYMTTLLRHALERHMRAGGHALLMSATLTGEARAKLLMAGLKRNRAEQLRQALAQVDAPYPCLATASGIVPCAGSSRVKQVRVALQGAMRDAAAVARIAVDAAAQGARVLVLRNTVRQAVATQLAIEAELGASHPALFALDGVVAMHHGRYAFADRQKLDARVEALFGKTAARSTAAQILVGTQTLEISVDCDSDLMISDIVPIDVLLQRLGRLHRHEPRDDVRSAAVQTPRVVVLTPAERDMTPLLAPGGARGLGIGRRSAYENVLAIEATWRLLEAMGGAPFTLPADNRRLVEAGASTQALSALADRLGGPWIEHFQSIFAKASAQSGQALPLQVNWHKRWGEDGWSELGDDVRTRLGLDGMELVLRQPWTTPFGACIEALTVPAWMLGKTQELPVVQAQDECDAELAIEVNGVSLRYGRLGLRKLE
jgi:CRISPR-associated endonuclease/helicase Cas3